MKKKLALLLAGVLAMGCLSACGGTDETVKVGLGVYVDLAGDSEDATTENVGVANANVYAAAVTVDSEGKVVKVDVDQIQVNATFDATGAVVAGTDQTFLTKAEQGDDYGMKAVMSDGCIGEWYQQVANFESWCEGKTASEIEAALGSDGKAADKVLITGCTIYVNGLIPTVVRAINDASVEASATDELSLGVVGSISSATFDAENLGAAEATADLAAVTTNAKGEITACVLDTVKASFAWNAKGQLTSDLSTEPVTNYDQGDGYNMKLYMGDACIAEWYVQADNFMSFVTGMTADEVKAIAMNEKGVTTDKVLITGCTIKIDAFQATVLKALAK